MYDHILALKFLKNHEIITIMIAAVKASSYVWPPSYHKTALIIAKLVETIR